MRYHPRNWPWLTLCLWVGLAALACWVMPPYTPYRAACGEFLDQPIDAALRPVFIQRLREALTWDGVPYFMWNGQPYLPLFDSFDRLNWERKYAFSIASGDAGLPPPPAVDRLVARWEAAHGRTLPRNRRGWVDYDEFRKLDECAVKRAALTFADGD